MAARYKEIEAVPAGRATVRVRFRLEGIEADQAGWQLYDPASGRFLTEGTWVRIEPHGTVELTIQLLPQDGPYRIYISPRSNEEWSYVRGDPFVVVDAALKGGEAILQPARVTTLRDLRRTALLESLPGLIWGPVATVLKNRTLIHAMVRRDILARYRGSFGDAFWTVLNPLMLMATYFFVFGVVLGTRFGPDQSRTGFALYFLAGFMPWLAMSEAMGRSPGSIVDYRNIVRKLLFPVETIPVNFVFAGLMTELFALAIYLPVLALINGGLPAAALWLPALIIPQVLFTAGVCWLLAATGVFLRDLVQMIGLLLTLWFFITPICYPESQLVRLPAAAFWILKKNPVYVLVRAYRAILLEGHAPDFGPLWKLWLLAIAVCILGYAWFFKLKKSFADVL